MAEILTFPRAPRPVPDRAAVRLQVEAAAQAAIDTADRLIGLLDAMDGDPDLEDGADDEPSLGAPEGHVCQVVWLRGSDRDGELTSAKQR